MSYPMMMKRAQLRELLREHGIGKSKMEEMIVSGQIEKRYLPMKCRAHKANRKRGRFALYSLTQVQRDILGPLGAVCS